MVARKVGQYARVVDHEPLGFGDERFKLRSLCRQQDAIGVLFQEPIELTLLGRLKSLYLSRHGATDPDKEALAAAAALDTIVARTKVRINRMREPF
jgi:hypothetical protein